MFTHELVLNKKAVKGSHCCFHLLCTVVLKANALRLVSYKVHTYHYIRVTSIHSRKQLLKVSLETLFKISPGEWKCCLHSQFDRGRTRSSAHLMGDHMPNLRVFAMFTFTRNLFIEFQRQNSLLLNLINIKIVN